MPLSLKDARAAVMREMESILNARADALAKPGSAGRSHSAGGYGNSYQGSHLLEVVALDEAWGRILVSPVLADRDQPPFDRVTRDGFAVRARDVAAAAELAPARLRVIGEAPPGAMFAGVVGAGEAVEIMTGAPLPTGADAVVMVEYTGEAGHGGVVIKRSVAPGENIVPRGSEIAAGEIAYPAGRRLDAAAIGLLASLGCARPQVCARPVVVVVTTGDELVPVEETPTPSQIRNSNRFSLGAQITQAGGVARPTPVAPDDPAKLRRLLEAELPAADLLLLSGGVSMGKYDFVEAVLGEMGARVIFDGVAIRPGKPLVFGIVAGKPFFGLPGNPLSTLVTFELFVRPALERLAGVDASPLRFAQAHLAVDFTQRKLPLTAFVPSVHEGETAVRPLPTQGSGDLAAMARADCWMVVEPGTEHLSAGALVPVLPKHA